VAGSLSSPVSRSRRGPLYEAGEREPTKAAEGRAEDQDGNLSPLLLPDPFLPRRFLSFYFRLLRTARSAPRTQMRANKMDRKCAGELSPATSASLFLAFPFTALRVVPVSLVPPAMYIGIRVPRPLPPFFSLLAVTFRFTFAATRS